MSKKHRTRISEPIRKQESKQKVNAGNNKNESLMKIAYTIAGNNRI